MAHRPAAPVGAHRGRPHLRDPPARRPRPGDPRAGPGRERLPARPDHGRVPDRAEPLHRPARHRARVGPVRPYPLGDRAHDGVLRQHGGGPRRPLGQSRVPRPGPHHQQRHPRRDGPPGRAVRPHGGGAQAGAAARPEPAGRAPVHAAARADDRPLAAARRRGRDAHPATGHDPVRPHVPDQRPAGRRPGRVDRILLRAVRPRAGRTAGGALLHGHGRRAVPAGRPDGRAGHHVQRRIPASPHRMEPRARRARRAPAARAVRGARGRGARRGRDALRGTGPDLRATGRAVQPAGARARRGVQGGAGERGRGAAWSAASTCRPPSSACSRRAGPGCRSTRSIRRSGWPTSSPTPTWPRW